MIRTARVCRLSRIRASQPTYWHTVDQQKSLCQLLGQLDIEHGLDSRSILKLNILLAHHEEVLQHPFFLLKLHATNITSLEFASNAPSRT